VTTPRRPLSGARKSDLRTTSEAASAIGITYAQFRRIAAARGRRHDDTYRSGYATGLLWSRRTVADLSRTREVRDAIARRPRLDALRERRLAELRAAEQAEAERQRVIERRIAALDLEPLVALAVDSLHARNRAAKHHRGSYEAADTYDAKDALLTALVRAGRGRVESFTISRESRWRCCMNCDRSWIGGGTCFGCNGRADRVVASETWFVVIAGRHRFHQPRLAPDLQALATPCEAHDPDQPLREVPEVHLGSEKLDGRMQLYAIEHAIARLTRVP
jgi:hypothetical protein